MVRHSNRLGVAVYIYLNCTMKLENFNMFELERIPMVSQGWSKIYYR